MLGRILGLSRKVDNTMTAITALPPEPFLDRGTLKKVLLAITDISGYTRYMTRNKTDLLHSQVLLTEITQTLLKQVECPLQVSKLEGDAIFLYAEVGDDWESKKERVSSQILSFFEAFTHKITELSECNICPCTACNKVGDLKLKVVVHYGEALIHKIGPFQELSGVDVITVHRLLKNSISAEEYLLVTESALPHLDFREQPLEVQWRETYDQIGEIRGKAWLAEEIEVQKQDLIRSGIYRSLSTKLANEWMKVKRILTFKLRPSRVPSFQHLS